MTVIATQQEMIEAIAYAAIARRKAELALEDAHAKGLGAHFIRQHERKVSENERYLRKVTELLAAHCDGQCVREEK